jgi:hypothetical protein
VHPTMPRMRMELRAAITWKDEVEAAFGRLAGVVRPASAPQTGQARGFRLARRGFVPFETGSSVALLRTAPQPRDSLNLPSPTPTARTSRSTAHLM